MKIVPNSYTTPKTGKWTKTTRTKNLSKSRTENTTPILFTNNETEWEETATATTEKNKLSSLADAVVKLLVMNSDRKEHVTKIKNIRKKRAQTYTGELITHRYP